MSGTSALMLTNRGYPTPDVSAIFAKDVYDWTTVSTLSSMPSGGSISRTGQAMVYDSAGKLTYAPNNLLLNTATLSTQSVTTAAINYILSFSGTGSVALSGAYTGNLAGTGASNRVSLAFTSTAASLTITVTGSVTSAQLEAVTYQTTPSTYVATTSSAYYGPRFDYDPSTLAAKGLLIEGTRTNLCIYSQTTSDANWTVTGGAKTSTNNDDPFGTSTAMLFTASATTTHFIGAGSYSYTSGTVYCGSCFVKAGTASLVQFTFNTGPFGSSQYANFNLSGAGSVTASSGGTGYITQLANGWYRIAFSAPATATAASAAGVIALISSTTDARLPSFASTGTIYATGWQLEIGAFPTSYIPVPTTGSTARAAETFAITGYSSNLINATYIDEQTGVASVQPYNAGVAPSTSDAWLTSLRIYQNAYANSIASPSWLSFSRAGNAIVTDSTGKLTYAPANMLTYSQDVSNAVWTKYYISGTAAAGIAPDGTLTANLIAEGGATNSHFLMTGSFAQSAGIKYIGSVYLKKGSGATAPDIVQIGMSASVSATNYANFNLSTGVVSASLDITGSIVSVGNGWYRCSVYATAATTSTTYGIIVTFVNNNSIATRNPSYAGSPTSDLYVWGAQFEAVTYETSPGAYIPTTTAAVYGPRYDFDASTVPATPRGLLIEESRANLLTYSETLGIFTAENATNVSSAITGPNGVASSARKIVESATSAIHGMYAGFTAANSMYTGSIYLKAGERSQVMVFLYDITTPAQYPVTVNLITGTIVGTNTAPYKIENVGNGWFRVSITSTNPLSAGSSRLWVRMYDNAGNATYLGDGASGFYAWGYQVEAGSFATSYIPTTSASVTRAADVAQLTGSALTTLQGSAFSYLVETSLYSTSNSPIVFGVGTAASPIYATGNTSANSYDSASTPTQTGAAFAGSGSFITTMRAGFSTNTSGRSLVLNNGTVASASGALGTARTAVAISGYTNATQMANGYFRSLALYNQRLPDAILKQKSSVNAPY